MSRSEQLRSVHLQEVDIGCFKPSDVVTYQLLEIHGSLALSAVNHV